MSLIEDIRKDRDRPQVREKSAPKWAAITNRELPSWVEVIGPSITIGGPTAATNLNGEDYIARHADARRIARVPQMEAALLAADALVETLKRSDSWFEIDAALDVYNVATGAS
jgi:hypothetical protein